MGDSNTRTPRRPGAVTRHWDILSDKDVPILGLLTIKRLVAAGCSLLAL